MMSRLAGTAIAGGARMHTLARVPQVLMAVGVAVLIATPAWAGAPTEQIKQQVDKAVQILDDPALKNSPAERHEKVRKVIEEVFDYPDTARRALGPHWTARSSQEREEFTRLFAEILDRAYVSKIDQYQGEKIAYLGDSINGDEATVKTRIVTPKGTEIPVEYRTHLKDGRWKVYDVSIEGVSLVSNYRTQFNKVITTESYDALVQRLRTKEPDSAGSASGSSGRKPKP
jgi:phospholipid transport system substrate-binding protein